jgi:hypothetical protein
MHVTDKIVDKDGVHILSSTLEADGPFVLASEKATLDAKVIALRRTDSGGVFLQTAVTITEPTAAAPELPKTVEQEAAAYLASKGFSSDDAKAAIARFGADRILQRRDAEEKAKAAELDDELDNLLLPDPSDPSLDVKQPAPNPPALSGGLAGSGQAPAPRLVAPPTPAPSQPTGNASNQNEAAAPASTTAQAPKQ